MSLNRWLLWLLGLVLLLWFNGCYESCSKPWQYLLCPDCGSAAVVPPVVPQDTVQITRQPIDFEWANPKAFQNPGYQDELNRIKEGLADGQNLEISGYYYAGEPVPEGFANMGEARAASIRDMLVPGIPADRIILKGVLRDGNGADVREGYFRAYDHRWFAVSSVEEYEGCVIFRFPYDSSQRIADKAVLDRLNELAERVKKTGEKLTVTGHTDSDGNEAYNMRLGQSRANQIKEVLRRRGVNNSQISTASKGETAPVASNTTDAGKAQNRRVEVCLVQ